MKALIACGLLVACTPHEENLGFTPAVGATRWAVTVGTSYDDRAMGVAIDSIGDVVAAGDGQGPSDQWGSPSDAGFVTKRVASDGSERWTVHMLPQYVDSYAGAMGVAVDAQDNVIVIGSYIGTVDFGGQTLALNEPSPPNRGDTFIAKYSWDGHLLWVRGLDSVADSNAYAVAIDSQGRILVAGTYAGSLTFAGHTFSASTRSGYVAALDPTGAIVWGAGFAGTNGVAPEAIAIAPNDDVLVAGGFAGSASFGGAQLDPGASTRAFLVRYRKDGLFLSSQVLGAAGAGESDATNVAASTAGQIIVQTIERDKLGDFAYAAVHVFDDSMHEVWSAKLDDHGSVNPQRRTLATTPTGRIVSSAWDDYPGDGSMEVVAYDPAAGHGMSTFGTRVVSASQATMPWSCDVSPSGAVAYAGQMSGTVDFGSGPLQTHANGDADAFIVLVDPPAP